MDTRKEIEFFDKFEETHGDYDVLGEHAYKRLLDIFKQRLDPKEGQSCLDLGCGTGAFTRRLECFNLKLHAMDISPASIERAKEKAPSIAFKVGDIRNTDYADNSMDIVVFSGVLHHLSSLEDRHAAMVEAHRVLKPGGSLYSFDPYQRSLSMFLYRDPHSPFFSETGKTDNEILIGRDQIIRELDDAGYVDIDPVTICGITYRYVEGSFARKMLPLYNAYEMMMMWTKLEKLAGTFIVGIAKKRS